MNTKPLPVVAGLVLAVGLAACTAAPEGASTPGSAGASPSGSSPSGASGPALSPFEQFWSDLSGLGADAQTRADRMFADDEEIENRIARCMSDAGFSYTPHPLRTDVADVSVDVDGVSDADRDDRAWVERWGYGVVQNPGRSASERSGWADVDAAPSTDDDPNAAYREGLAPAQRTAYDDALWGPPWEEGMPEEGLADLGCMGAATAAVRGIDPRDDPRFEPVLSAMDEVTNAFPWPGIPEVDAEWSACMSAAGQAGFARPDDASASIASALNALWDIANPGVVFGDGRRLASPPVPDLEALATAERELALDDLACRDQVRYRERCAEIQTEVEGRFLADHEQELAALRAEYQR